MVRGKKQIPVGMLCAGDIGALSKLQYTSTGDSLCEIGKVVQYDSIDFPAPQISLAVYAKKAGDEDKVFSGLARLCEEMPDVIVAKDPMTTETLHQRPGRDWSLKLCASKLAKQVRRGTAVLKDPKIAVPRVHPQDRFRCRAVTRSRAAATASSATCGSSSPRAEPGDGFRVRRCGRRRRGAAQLHPRRSKRVCASASSRACWRAIPMIESDARSSTTAAITRSTPPKWRSRRRRASPTSRAASTRTRCCLSRSCTWKSACRMSTWAISWAT